MGSSEFTLPALEALLDPERSRSHDVAAVFTAPPRPKGRGRRLLPTPVGEYAVSKGIPVLTPAAWDAAAVESLSSLGPDLVLTAAYGKILPREALEIPGYGSVNIHASLLPDYRGAAPVARAIQDGVNTTGVTFFLMNEEMDSGPILGTLAYEIWPDETRGEVEKALADMAASAALDIIDEYLSGDLKPIPQDDSRATYARKVKKAEGRASWDERAESIHHRVMAFNPWPLVRTTLLGNEIILRRTSLREGEGPPGAVISRDPLIVACGSGAIEIVEAARPGSGRMSGGDLLRGLKP